MSFLSALIVGHAQDDIGVAFKGSGIVLADVDR
jgi:hypothetical protein